MSEHQTGNGFVEYRRMILADIKRLEENDARILEKLDQMLRQIVELKVKSSLVGAVAGVLASAAVVFLSRFIK